MNIKKTGKLLSAVLSIAVFLSAIPLSFAGSIEDTDMSEFSLITGTDFEDGNAWGFVAGTGAGVTVQEDVYGNSYLEATGSGNGGRSITKALDVAIDESLVFISFDWKPGDVSSSLNSSEILFRDSDSKPIFRLVKAGGTNGEIQYGVGTTGIDLNGNVTIAGETVDYGIKRDESWLTVNLLFDFTRNKVSLKVCNLGESTGFEGNDIPLAANNGKIKTIAINGNRASGNTLGFTTCLDNFYIYGKTVTPAQPANIVSISSDFTKSYTFPTGTAKDSIISRFPGELQVNLENNTVASVKVNWECNSYDPDTAGEYTFTGTFVIEDGSYIKNDNNIYATITVITREASPIPDIEGYTYLFGTDFENLDAWGFSGNASPGIATDDGNYLKAGVENQSGGRSAAKTFEQPVNHSKVIIQFDWRPGTVSTGSNSSEILFSDSANNPIFRIVKAGGTNGAIKYDVGSTGDNIENIAVVTGVSTNGAWLSVDVRFDFEKREVSFTVKDRDNPSNSFAKTGISLIDVNHKNDIGKMAINGNRASGQSLTFETGLDNILIYGSGTPAPEPDVKKIVSILTDYEDSLTIPMGSAKKDVLTLFPTSFEVLLDDGGKRTIPITWDCEDFDSSLPDTFAFKTTFVLDGFVAVTNPDNVEGVIYVTPVPGETVPDIEGFVNQYYTTFGDVVPVIPANWGFTTSSAELSINTDNIAGNNTPKLQFSINNQAGGRVATKTLEPAAQGNIILVKFDWYPGPINDKGSNPNENGGEFKIEDSSGNTVFTINNTRNSPLKFSIGNNAFVETSHTNPLKWYGIEIYLNVLDKQAQFVIHDKAENIKDVYDLSLDGVNFDGSIKNIKLQGVRTSGNNLTSTTYLDNFGIYVVPAASNTVAYVEKLPYHRVYVGETTDDLSSIGLPGEVPVRLVSGERVNIPVARWTVTGREWNPEEPGVYTFIGILAETDEYDNLYNRTATLYVYNRLPVPDNKRQAEWLDRGVIALSSGDGIFISWRLRADEYSSDVKFNIYRNGEKLNSTPLSVTNYLDAGGKADDTYKVETLLGSYVISSDETTASDRNYLSIPVQKPADGVNRIGETYTYSLNDASVGDLDGDGEYEIIVKWYPSNAIDSSQSALTGPTIFDAYKLDGTLLWRMDMGLNLTSGAHYHQFLVYDFDGDGRSEMFIKTADGTTVYGATNGIFDSSKVISQIGKPEDNYKYINDSGKVVGGPEYISIFDGETGEVIDTIEYQFPVDYNPIAWGDDWHNRSDRFLAAVAYLDGETPSAVFGRGYYEKTTFVAYKLVDGKLVTEWIFDTDKDGRQYMGLGNHNLSVADVDNDGFDEIIAGALTLDHDGTVLYAMDGAMNREKGSHGDAMHVGAFDPDLEGLQVFSVFEDPAVASMQYRDAATGETYMSYYASKDTGRGVAANIASEPGYEFWGAADFTDVQKGSGLYNVKGKVLENDWRALGLSANFALYWDGDLQHELLDDISITKYNEKTKSVETLIEFTGCVSNNGTKATPTLQGDIIGDWREEVVMPSDDSTELRIYSTTIPTEYRLFTLMHDHVYRMGIAWQNVAYNQPPHISFYLGEDIRDKVLAGAIETPNIYYTEKTAPSAPVNLRIAAIDRTTATLAWEPAIDKSMVEYEIYMEEVLKGRTGNLSYTVTGLTPGTKYTFKVYAYDVSGNRSEAAAITGTTSPASGSGGGGQSRPSREPNSTPTPAPSPTAIPRQTVEAGKPAFNEDTGEASVKLNKNIIKNAFENAVPGENGVKTVLIEIPEVDGATSYTLSLDASILAKAGSANEKIELKTPFATLTLSGNMLSNSYTSSSGEITLKIGKADINNLPDDVKSAIGGRPVIELGLYLNNEPIGFNNPNSPVLISIPYEPSEEELKNPENIVVWYIDSSGNAVPVPTGRYNAEKGTVEFITYHFSKYAVVHSFKTFEDLDGYDWVKREIEILAARGIIKGTSATTFKPGDNLTRADFTLLLVRALGLNARVVSNFADVRPDDYFHEGMGIAKALGIVKGTGNNMGSPREAITRQEMMVMAARALRLANKLEAGSVDDLEDITDRDEIAPYAIHDIASLVKAGIIPEYETNTVRPAKQATRAEAAKLIYRLYNIHNK